MKINPANQFIYIYGTYPIIYGVLYIPGGTGFLPSTVCYGLLGGIHSLYRSMAIVMCRMFVAV